MIRYRVAWERLLPSWALISEPFSAVSGLLRTFVVQSTSLSNFNPRTPVLYRFDSLLNSLLLLYSPFSTLLCRFAPTRHRARLAPHRTSTRIPSCGRGLGRAEAHSNQVSDGEMPRGACTVKFLSIHRFDILFIVHSSRVAMGCVVSAPPSFSPHP